MFPWGEESVEEVRVLPREEVEEVTVKHGHQWEEVSDHIDVLIRISVSSGSYMHVCLQCSGEGGLSQPVALYCNTQVDKGLFHHNGWCGYNQYYN